MMSHNRHPKDDNRPSVYEVLVYTTGVLGVGVLIVLSYIFAIWILTFRG